jgi:hypothetical protein
MYNESYKTLKKQIEEDSRRWRDFLCSWIGRINVVIYNITDVETIYRFNVIPSNVLMTFFTERKFLIII